MHNTILPLEYEALSLVDKNKNDHYCVAQTFSIKIIKNRVGGQTLGHKEDALGLGFKEDGFSNLDPEIA